MICLGVPGRHKENVCGGSTEQNGESKDKENRKVGGGPRGGDRDRKTNRRKAGRALNNRTDQRGRIDLSPTGGSLLGADTPRRKGGPETDRRTEGSRQRRVHSDRGKGGGRITHSRTRLGKTATTPSPPTPFRAGPEASSGRSRRRKQGLGTARVPVPSPPTPLPGARSSQPPQPPQRPAFNVPVAQSLPHAPPSPSPGSPRSATAGPARVPTPRPAPAGDPTRAPSLLCSFPSPLSPHRGFSSGPGAAVCASRPAPHSAPYPAPTTRGAPPPASPGGYVTVPGQRTGCAGASRKPRGAERGLSEHHSRERGGGPTDEAHLHSRSRPFARKEDKPLEKAELGRGSLCASYAKRRGRIMKIQMLFGQTHSLRA